MDFGKKVRFSLERLETRAVPARLGQFVELPYAAAPAAEVALTAPADLGHGPGAGLKVDWQGLANMKIDPSAGVSLKYDPTVSAGLKVDPSQVGGTATTSDHVSIDLSLNFMKIKY
jgi:hypothetical protein